MHDGGTIIPIYKNADERFDKIEKRIKQLECEHGPYVFGVQFIKYAKKCTKCDKIWVLENECEWLKQKHEQEQKIADATAKELKGCKA